MSKIDIILIIVLVLGLWAGYRWGIVAMIFSLISLLAGAWLIGAYAPQIHNVENLMKEHGASLYFVACGIILLGAFLIGWMASWVVEKALKLVLLNWVNKGIGAIFGLLVALVFSTIGVFAALRIPPQKPLIGAEEKANSRFIRYLDKAGSMIPGSEGIIKTIQPLQQSLEE